MFFLSRPSNAVIRTILGQQRAADFPHSALGASRGQLPASYTMIHSRVNIGQGAATFARAVQALCHWKMFDAPNVYLCWSSAPVQAGIVVGILIKHFGFWSLNFCRIVYLLEEEGPVRRYGFGYGTLRDHAEQGEERFTMGSRSGGGFLRYFVFLQTRLSADTIGLPTGTVASATIRQNSLAAMVDAVRYVAITLGS